MQFLTNTHINFMALRKPLGALSVLLVIAALVVVFGLGHLNIGIDFAGGTQVTVKFTEPVAIDEVRSALADAGFVGAGVQRFGDDDANEVLIRTKLEEDQEEGSSDAILDALDQRFNAGAPGGSFDLNRKGREDLVELLVGADPEDRVTPEEAADPLLTGEGEAYYEAAADAILDERKEQGLIDSFDQLTTLAQVSPDVAQTLRDQTRLGGFSLLSAENVGPQIGSELASKGMWAIILSMIGMLGYIWLRFELRFGIGAVAAIIHDVAIVLGLYALAGYEFNLTTIAAFLTLVGYSVNDTVVVFDRVRENMRKIRRESLVEVLNRSLNQTLARTIMTSLTTLLAVGMLYLFGGDVIRGFAFIVMIGVVVGTYSSIFVASPVVLLWEKWFGHKVRAKRAAAAASASRPA